MWKKSGKGGVLICGGPSGTTGCGAVSQQYPILSPAAPELTICEQAEKDGWAYDIGFFAMMTGHTTLCPQCVAKAETQ